jgi:hypothetical protein
MASLSGIEHRTFLRSHSDECNKCEDTAAVAGHHRGALVIGRGIDLFVRDCG